MYHTQMQMLRLYATVIFIPNKMENNHTVTIVSIGRLIINKIFNKKLKGAFTFIFFLKYIKQIRIK